RYSYVLNNPMRYTDPSGNIEQNEAHEAYDIIRQLLEEYDINLEIDFGWLTGTYWDVGFWTIDDMRAFATGVKGFAAALGGAASFQNNLGHINVNKRVFDNYSEAGMGFIHFCAWGRVSPFLSVHELAHAWNGYIPEDLAAIMADKTGSIQYEDGQYRPGLPGAVSVLPLNYEEDFADAIAGYIYPSEASRMYSSSLEAHKTASALTVDTALLNSYRYYQNNPRYSIAERLIGGKR
ncbi:MAG: hypothetical protein LLG44_11635, partial [Chloroflexi bacterium]|nr:hypothetical protein [Chloroflexota bacterium]